MSPAGLNDRVNEEERSIHRARRARLMNLVALALFITALLALVGFHFVAWNLEPDSEGWHIWPDIVETVRSRDFSEPIFNTGLLMFPSFAVLTLASPFLIGVIRKFRLAWWLLVLLSGGCLIALGAFAFVASEPAEPADPRGPGFYWLIAALVLNFLGMVFVRQDMRADAGASHPPAEN